MALCCCRRISVCCCLVSFFFFFCLSILALSRLVPVCRPTRRKPAGRLNGSAPFPSNKRKQNTERTTYHLYHPNAAPASAYLVPHAVPDASSHRPSSMDQKEVTPLPVHGGGSAAVEASASSFVGPRRKGFVGAVATVNLTSPPAGRPRIS